MTSVQIWHCMDLGRVPRHWLQRPLEDVEDRLQEVDRLAEAGAKWAAQNTHPWQLFAMKLHEMFLSVLQERKGAEDEEGSLCDRYRVAWHQYHMMHATTLLRQSLPMHPRTDGIRSNADSRSTPVWYTKLRRRVVSLNPDNTTLRAQVHYKPREGGRNKRGPKRPRSSPDTRASYILQQPYSNSTACTLLRLLSSLSPPLQAKVHDYVSNPSTPSNLGPRRPPLVRRGLPGEIFLMRSVAQLHTLWRDIRRELQAHYRSYTLLLHMACKTTVWLRAMVSAWRAPMLSARYLFRTSCFQGAMHAKMHMARALLTYHNYTLSYLPTLKLATTLLGVYQRQTRTIGGATLHHASMSHQKYMTWASMMAYRMRAHEQWLRTCMGEAERLYRAACSNTSRSIRSSYAALVHSHHKEAYESSVALKRRLHSQYVGLSTGRLLARQWGDWVTVTEHWQEVAWREKGQYSESELAALRVLQLKRRRPLSPDVRVCKRRCLHPPSPAAVQLTGSPDSDGIDLPFTQLTGSPIREIHF